MQNVIRFDLQFLGKNVKTTPQGFLVIPAYTARTGLQEYKKLDGSTIVEYRPEEEVFSEGSMSSLRTAAVTNKHPITMVCPKTAKEIMVGHTDGHIEKKHENGEGYLATNLVITHEDAIESVRKGRCEISNGYTCDLEFTPGEYNGEKYDAIQRNIVNNHIAIVDRGRAGRNVRLKLDSLDAIINDEEEVKTMKIKIGQREFDVADDLGTAVKEALTANETALTQAKTDHESVKADLTKVTTEKEALVAKTDALESDLTKLKAAPPVIKMDAAELNLAVKERVAIIKVGEKMLDAETVKKLDEMSNEEIKKAVIKVDSPSIDEAKLAKDSYVDARFDHICENVSKTDKAADDLGKKITEARTDGKADDKYVSPEKARLDGMEKAAKESVENKVGLTKETVK